jgi:MSHA biogenesis protein MshG
VLVLACVFLIGFVITKFADMFARRGADLPWMTEALMLLGLSFQNHWAVYLAVSVGAWFTAARLFSGASGRLRLERIIALVPYVREVFTGIGVSRFTRVLGIGVASGLSLIESLELAGKASVRSLLGEVAHRLWAKIRSGSSLAAAMHSSESLPAFALRMLAAGERAGDIPSMCSVVSRHFEREAADRTKNLSTVLEPLLIVSIAGIVRMLALAIFLPMWDSVKLVG